MSKASEWAAAQPVPFSEVGLLAWVDPGRGMLNLRTTSVAKDGATVGLIAPEQAVRFARWIIDTFSDEATPAVPSAQREAREAR